MNALLDDIAAQQGGAQIEGEPPPVHCPDARVALACWNHLATGMGGMDWHGLPIVVELLGVADAELDLLLHRLHVIKRHKPTKG